jgi:hypothetical protein
MLALQGQRHPLCKGFKVTGVSQVKFSLWIPAAGLNQLENNDNLCFLSDQMQVKLL